MTSIKRGTTPTLRVQIDGIAPADVKTVEFIFKLRPSDREPSILYKAYPDSMTFDKDSETWLVPFTDAETRLFIPRSTVYMDTRIILLDGTIPTTEIVSFTVTDTLFEEAAG